MSLPRAHSSYTSSIFGRLLRDVPDADARVKEAVKSFQIAASKVHPPSHVGTNAVKRPTFKTPHDMVTIIVQNEKKFVIHKEFACFYSPVLKAAFTGTYLEGQTQTMTLEDVGGAVFESFMTWIYTQSVAKTEDFDGAVLINLWILADRLLIPRLKNIVIMRLEMGRVAGMHAELFPLEMARYVFKHTTAGSPLRRYIVDICAWKFNEASYADSRVQEMIPVEMLFELLQVHCNIAKEEAVKIPASPLSCADSYFVSWNAKPEKPEVQDHVTKTDSQIPHPTSKGSEGICRNATPRKGPMGGVQVML